MKMKLIAKAAVMVILCSGGAARAADDKPLAPLEGLKLDGEVPVPAGLEELAKKHNLALPKDIKKALDECRAEGGDPTCVNEKLAAAGFNVPPLPEGAKELSACIRKAKEGSNKDEDTKACLAKHAPKAPSQEELEKLKDKNKENKGTNSTSAV